MKDNTMEMDFPKALLLLIISWVLAATAYMAFSILFGSLSPDAWGKRAGYTYILIFGGMFLLALAYYYAVSRKLDMESFMKKLLKIEAEQLQKQLPLEAVLSHYGNMASSGLFLTVFIFSIKPLISSQSVIIVGPVLAFGLLSILAIYSFILVKPMLYFCKYKAPFAIMATMIIVLIDMQAFRLLISSIPK